MPSPSAASNVAVPAPASSDQEEMSTVRPCGAVRRKTFSAVFSSGVQPEPGFPETSVTPLVFQPSEKVHGVGAPKLVPPGHVSQTRMRCHPVFVQA